MHEEQLKPHPDPEIRAFEEALLRSVEQAKRGEFAAVHTPAQIEARRKGGCPRKLDAKQSVKLRLDPDLLAALRATGDGWQTRINDTLRASMHLAGRV